MNRFLYGTGVFLLMIAGILHSSIYGSFQKYFLFAALLVFFIRSKEGRILPVKGNLVMLWGLFAANIAFGLLSSVLNRDAVLGIEMLEEAGVFFFLMLDNEGNSDLVNPILILTFAIHAVIALASSGIALMRYYGYYLNPNLFGLVSSCFFAYFACMAMEQLRYRGWNALCAGIAFFFVVISSSRTSFIGSVLVLALAFLYKSGGGWLAKRMVRNYVFLLAAVMVVNFLPPFSGIVKESIWDKFGRHPLFQEDGSMGTLFSNREITWIEVWNERSLFGYGVNYFRKFIYGAHSTYMQLLGYAGVFVMFAFALFLIVMLMYLWVKRKHYSGFLPMAMCIQFMVMSATERLLLRLGMFVMYLAFGIAVNQVMRSEMDETPGSDGRLVLCEDTGAGNGI